MATAHIRYLDPKDERHLHRRGKRGFSRSPVLDLARRLRHRLSEIEEATLTRCHAIADPAEVADPEYGKRLRCSLTVAIEYAVEAVEMGESRAPQVPQELLSQARLAARNNVPLDVVLRRYLAGYCIFAEYVLRDVITGDHASTEWLQQTLRGQSAIFDRLITTVSEEHRKEQERPISSPHSRRLARVRRLLEGETIDTTDLNYDLDHWHIGVAARGSDLQAQFRELASRWHSSCLLIRSAPDQVWVWFGSKTRLGASDSGRLIKLVNDTAAEGTVIGVGEPAEAARGWRLTHRQAMATLALNPSQREGVLRYRDIALVSALLENDLLATSLRTMFLAPLEETRDEGQSARETLQAYFSTQGNISSAAALLGVKRHTVTNRLRAIEERLGRSLTDCHIEMQAALQVDEHHAVATARSTAMTLLAE